MYIICADAHGKDRFMFKKGMIRFRRKMAALLAAAMLVSSFPVPAQAAGNAEGASGYAAGIGEEPGVAEVIGKPVKASEPGSNDPVVGNEGPTELYFSDITDESLIYADDEHCYFIKSASFSFDGFTLTDCGAVPQDFIDGQNGENVFPDRGNKIRVFQND